MKWILSSIIFSVNVHYIVCDSYLSGDFPNYVIRIFLIGNLKSFAQNSPNDAERLESTPGVDLMHLAAAYGRTDIVDILLKRLHQDDIDPEELFDLNSSLHHASKLNNKLLAEMLLKAGAYPWYKDDDGFSAMHHAAFNDSLIVS